MYTNIGQKKKQRKDTIWVNTFQWLDDIKTDLEQMDWIHVAQD